MRCPTMCTAVPVHKSKKHSFLVTSTKDSALLRRPRLLFVIIDGLLYNIRANGIYTLYIPYSEVLKHILAITYDEKHYFGKERILYDLQGLSISNRTYIVKSYIKHCPIY